MLFFAFFFCAEKKPFDVALALSGHGADYAGQAVRNICENYAEVREEITDFKFPRRGLRKMPVTDIRGAMEWALLLPGRHAVRIGRQAADLLVRYLGGDLGIIDPPVCQHMPDAEDTAVNRMHSLNKTFANILPVC